MHSTKKEKIVKIKDKLLFFFDFTAYKQYIKEYERGTVPL